MTKDRDRRRAIVFVGEDVLCRILDLPPSLRIIGVKADWERMGVQIMVEGDDLDVVHPGTEPPTLPGSWEFVGDDHRPRFVPEPIEESRRG